MSERSVEDEFIAEARKFSGSMQAAMRRYAQASNWLERQRARREISLIGRREANDQAAARQRHLGYTTQAVDRYRVHALTIQQRANDPNIDHERRYRDAQALARHRNDMAERVLRNPHLTQVEQGIALDGLDSATVFPEFETGRLFDRAKKVKGIEALRYRAQVARARETAGIERPAVTAMRHVDRAAQDRPSAVFGDPGRSGQPGRATTVQAAEAQGKPLTAAQAAAVQDIRRSQLAWTESGSNGEPSLYWDHQRQLASDRAAGAGLSREQIRREFDNTVANSRVRASISHTSPQYPEPATIRAYFPTQAEAARWANYQVSDRDWRPGTELTVRAHEAGHRKPTFLAVGNEVTVGKATQAWQEQTSTTQSSPRVAGVSSEQERELSSLKDRHRLSIQYNGELTDRNAELVKNLTALTSERDDLAEELSELRTERKAGIAVTASRGREVYALSQELESVTNERDRLRLERDEAVRKLAERTPTEDRYGSAERQAAHAKVAARKAVRDTGGPRPTPTHEAGGRNLLSQYLGREVPDCGVYAFGDEFRDELRRDAGAYAGWVGHNVPEGQRDRWLADRDNILDAHAEIEHNLFAAVEDFESPLMKSKAQQLFPNGRDERAEEEMAKWWVSGGAIAYRAECEARDTVPHTQASAGRSPLADYQPGNALADAIARNGAERDGAERDGAER